MPKKHLFPLGLDLSRIGCLLQQANRLGAHRLRHATGLAVRPFDAAVGEVDPGPFELEDLRHPSRKLELQTNGEEDERVIKAFGLRLVQIGIQPLQLGIGDQPSLSSFREFRNVAAWVRSVRAQALDLRHVEHLADCRKDPVRIRRGFRHFLHQARDIRARDVGDLDLAEVGDDVEPAVAAVGVDRRGLVARLGVVGDEALEELFHCGRLARGTLLCTRILAFADVGQPVLGNGTGLLDSDLAKAPDGWFAALAVVGDIGHPEDLRPVGVTLSRKPGIAASRSS